MAAIGRRIEAVRLETEGYEEPGNNATCYIALVMHLEGYSTPVVFGIEKAQLCCEAYGIVVVQHEKTPGELSGLTAPHKFLLRELVEGIHVVPPADLSRVTGQTLERIINIDHQYRVVEYEDQPVPTDADADARGATTAWRFEMSDGSAFDVLLYNYHNGYYPHRILMHRPPMFNDNDEL
jgi:hypothetical protein